MKPKKIWKKRWKDEAVSPVIATILMVAITVVLAAVLYLLVTSMIPPTEELKPNVSLSEGIPTGNDGEWKVSVNTVDRIKGLTSFKIAVLNGTSVAIEATPLETVKSSGATSGSLSLEFYEPNGDNNLNAGDYFILSGTDSTSDYVIEVYYMDQGKTSGDTGKIQQ